MDYSVVMTASEAVRSLREKLGLGREQFGHRLGVSGKMIQRIEAGQQPTTGLLLKLAAMAGETGIQPLAELFDATRRANMRSRVVAVSDTARVRRVALNDLKYWSAYLYQTWKQTEDILAIDRTHPLPHGDLIEYLRNVAGVIDHIRDEIEIPIAEPPSFKRQEEDEMILRLHEPRLRQQGADNGKKKTRKR